MEAALEISFYVLGVVFAIGVLMVLVLVKDVFFHGRFNVILPHVRHVPTTALDAARATLRELKTALPAAQGERRDTIAYEIKHLEHRIAVLEDKTYTDQSDYYDAAKARERVWREWRSLHEQSRQAQFGERRRLRNRLDELRAQYRELDREVGEEYQRAVARDGLALEELRAQHVLEPEVLQPEAVQPAAGGAGAGPGQARPTPRSGKWMSPLPPYPPAEGGLLAQADLARPDAVKTGRTYVDVTLSTAALPGGALSGVDLSRSSFAEVEFVGPQHFVGCTLVATDLRRTEMRRAEQPHVFQDCDLHGASLAQAHLVGVVFRRCDLSGTHWRSARLDRVKFESCRLDNVRWEGVDLSRTVMSEDMLGHADLEFASKPPLNLRPAMESPPELSGRAPGAEPPPAQPQAPPRQDEGGAAAGEGPVDTPQAPPHAEPPAEQPAGPSGTPPHREAGDAPAGEEEPAEPSPPPDRPSSAREE